MMEGEAPGPNDWAALLKGMAEAAPAELRDPFERGASAHLSEMFVDEAYQPAALAQRFGPFYAPHRTVQVLTAPLKAAMDAPRGAEPQLEPQAAAQLQQALDAVADDQGRAIVRLGGRTPHDTGPPFISSAHEIAGILKGSERAMLEAWAWCSDRGHLPITFHQPVQGHEWRVLVDMDTASLLALSHSMRDSVYASAQEKVRPLAGACDAARHAQDAIRDMLAAQADAIGGMGRQWLDVLVDETGQLFVLDVNVDEPGTWMGGHEELDADPASGTTLWAEGRIWYWPAGAELQPAAAVEVKSRYGGDADSDEGSPSHT